MIDLRAIAVRLRDEAEAWEIAAEEVSNAFMADGFADLVYELDRDIATLDGIARALTEAGECG